MPSSGIPRARLLDSRPWLDNPFDSPRTLTPFDTMRRIGTPPCFLPNSRTVSRLLASTGARRSAERTSGNQQVHCEQEGYMSVQRNTLERDAMSAILNCLCPECGGVIQLETNRLECLRCGKHGDNSGNEYVFARRAR